MSFLFNIVEEITYFFEEIVFSVKYGIEEIFDAIFKVDYPSIPEEVVREMIEISPQMSFKSKKAKAGFDRFKEINSNNDYIKVIEFAEAWARLAEAERAKGSVLTPKLIMECGNIADQLYGNSGWTYNVARATLIRYWKYGFLARFTLAS